MADKGVARFDDEAAARRRLLRVAGLTGLHDEASTVAAGGVTGAGHNAHVEDPAAVVALAGTMA